MMNLRPDAARLLEKSRQSSRAGVEMLAGAMKELSLRVERERQSQPGGLIDFVRYFWDTIEPGRVFVEGWPLYAMCMHLEAVTYGKIRRLLINVPPGSMKSLLVNVFWPAWEWATFNQSIRYITFSYSSLLTERDNQRFMDIIDSAKFRDLWGHKFTLRQKGVTKVSNDKFGWKFASSVRGTGTGERADRVLCFPEETLVATEHGPMRIGDIVRGRLNVRVWSRNPTTGRIELRPVVGWKHNPGSDLVRVRYEGGSVRCTPDHRFWVEGRGWVEARSLRAGDMLPSFSGLDLVNSGPVKSVSCGDCVDFVSRVNYFERNGVGYFRPAGVLAFFWGVRSFARWMLGARSNVFFPEIKIKVAPSASCTDVVYGSGADVVCCGEFGIRPVVQRRDFAHMLLSEMRRAVSETSVLFTVGNVLRPCSVFEVTKAAVRPVVVAVSDFLSFGNRTDKTQHHELVGKDVSCVSVAPQCKSGVAVVESSFQESASVINCVSVGRVPVSVGVGGRTSFAGDGSGFAVDAAIVGNQVVGEADGFAPDFGAVLGVEDNGHVMETFCLTVEGNHSMAVGGVSTRFVIVSNCDDPHNIKEGESQKIREETVRWFREAMSNRLNDMDKSAIIVIMQRVHEDDMSGAIISDNLGYDHLMIPLRFERGRSKPTSIGWEDPRKTEGECFWPERFTPDSVEEIDKMGEFAVAAQYQQRPAPRGGGIFKTEYWKIYKPEDGKWPDFDFILASVDPAYTNKDENDPSGMVVLGVYYDEDGFPQVHVIAAWRKWLQLHGPKLVKGVDEPKELFLERQKKVWGLVEWIVYTCKRFKVNRLLVEAKATGLTVIQELERLLFTQQFGVEFVNPGRADKEVRANRVQHIFSAGMVWRPERAWAKMVEDEMATFPKAKYDDLTDAMTQALWWLRQHRMLARREELAAANAEIPPHDNRDSMPLYPM